MAQKTIDELNELSTLGADDLVPVLADGETVAKNMKGSTIKTYVKDGLVASDIIDFDTEVSNNTDVANATTHIARTDNPHTVTKTQVGLGNVDNTSDTDKPVSTATQSALDLKEDVANKKTTLADDSDTYYPSQKAVKTAVDAKQATLVSGTNIKTVNGQSILGSGDLTVSGTGDVSGPASSVADHIPQFSDTTGKVLKDGLGVVTSIGSPGADTNIPTEKAVRAAIAGAGGGDVMGPDTNTDGYIPQRDGANSKTLKNGIPTSTFAPALGADDNYVTNAEKVVIGNTSGTNTGDETQSTIKTKLGAASTSADGYLTSTDWNTFNGKQSALSKATGAEVDTGTDDTKYVTSKAIEDSSYIKSTYVTDANISISDITTNNASSSKHGFLPKLDNTGTKYLRDDGTWQMVSASGSSFWTDVPGTPTYASATTFTVTGDYTAVFVKGIVIKRVEGSTARCAMVSIPSTESGGTTTVTVIGDTIITGAGNFSTVKYSGNAIEVKKFALAGTIGATGTDVANAVYVHEPARVIGAEIMVGTVASTSGNTVVDINKGGTTMFTAKPTIAYNALTVATPFTADSATSLALNDRVTIDVDTVCSTTYPIDLYIDLYTVPTRFLSLT